MPGPHLASIQLSDGGVPKRPVPEAEVGAGGLSGDRQRDLRYHGGPDRAVCLFAAERLAALAAEGHPVRPGDAGENLTVAGLDWAAVVPGVELAVGPVRLLVTDYAAPCSKLVPYFAGGAFRRISQKVHPGWSRVYARVLRGGRVRAGDPVALAGAGGGTP